MPRIPPQIPDKGFKVHTEADRLILDYCKAGQLLPGPGVEETPGGMKLLIRDETTLQKLWWDMDYEETGGTVLIDIEDGMCEGPTWDSSAVHPQPMWGYTKVEDITQQEATNGTTYFYLKSIASEHQVDMGGPTANPLLLLGYRYSFGTFTIHKVTSATQPDDTDTIKYRLLGYITIESDRVTEYWWRTNHVFNFTSYSFTADGDDGNSDALPPGVPV